MINKLLRSYGWINLWPSLHSSSSHWLKVHSRDIPLVIPTPATSHNYWSEMLPIELHSKIRATFYGGIIMMYTTWVCGTLGHVVSSHTVHWSRWGEGGRDGGGGDLFLTGASACNVCAIIKMFLFYMDPSSAYIECRMLHYSFIISYPMFGDLTIETFAS